MRPDRRGLAAASIALSLAGVVSVVALHVLRPELAPLSHRLSEYAIGRYGGLMTAAFVCVGASLLMLAGALVEDDRRASARIVAAAVGVAGVGMMLSGVFRTDASRSGATADGLHSAASALATLALIATGAAVATQFGRAAGTAGAMQRLLAGAVLVWLVLVAMHVRRASFDAP